MQIFTITGTSSWEVLDDGEPGTILQHTLETISEDFRAQYRGVLAEHGFAVFLKGDILYRSPSSPEKQAVDKLDNAGFYWHSTSGEATTSAGIPMSGIYQFTVKTSFVLPILFSADIPSDLAYILVDRLCLSRVNVEYTQEMHETQGLTNFPTSMGNVACCSGSKGPHVRGKIR